MIVILFNNTSLFFFIKIMKIRKGYTMLFVIIFNDKDHDLKAFRNFGYII